MSRYTHSYTVISNPKGEYLGGAISLDSAGWIVTELNRLLAERDEALRACEAFVAAYTGKVTDPVEPGAPMGAALNMAVAALSRCTPPVTAQTAEPKP